MKSLFIRVRMIEDDNERDLVIVGGVIADAHPVPGIELDAAGWVLPGLVDVHNHLSLASPAGDHEDVDVRVRASASVELAPGSDLEGRPHRHRPRVRTSSLMIAAGGG
jgi:imidazolonepropionase-like amidohydrolase